MAILVLLLMLIIGIYGVNRPNFLTQFFIHDKLAAYVNHGNGNPSNNLLKTARIFDPRQVRCSTLSTEIQDYAHHIKGLDESDVAALLDEWVIYIKMANNQYLTIYDYCKILAYY